MSLIINELFADLTGWTLTETDGTVTASGGDMLIDRTAAASYNDCGAVYDTPFNAAVGGVLEIPITKEGNNAGSLCGFYDSSTLNNVATSLSVELVQATETWEARRNGSGAGGTNYPTSGTADNSAYYTCRFKFIDGGGGAIHTNVTIDGPDTSGEQTMLADTNDRASTNWYVQIQCRKSDSVSTDTIVDYVTYDDGSVADSTPKGPGGSELIHIIKRRRLKKSSGGIYMMAA